MDAAKDNKNTNDTTSNNKLKSMQRNSHSLTNNLQLKQLNEHDIYSAENSPFIIRHNIWPNQKYKFRIRLVSKLFPTQKSAWTKWSEKYLAYPPNINDIIMDNNDEKKKKK
eukprot:31696_1